MESILLDFKKVCLPVQCQCMILLYHAQTWVCVCILGLLQVSQTGQRRRTKLRRRCDLLPRGQRSAMRSFGIAWRVYGTSSHASSTRPNSPRICASARSSMNRMKTRCSTPHSTHCASARPVRGGCHLQTSVKQNASTSHQTAFHHSWGSHCLQELDWELSCFLTVLKFNVIQWQQSSSITMLQLGTANSKFFILLMVTNVLWKRTGQQDAIWSLIFTKVNWYKWLIGI